MPRTTLLDRIAPGNRSAVPPVRPRSLLHRHWIAVSVVAFLVLAGVLGWTRPWEQCGAGLTAADDVCVGLDLGAAPLRDDDPLADLEALIADRNAHAGSTFKTVVVLDDLTPDPDTDSTPIKFVRHGVQGAIAAAWPRPESSGIKLLLANFGSSAGHWREAVGQIVASAGTEHIAAVTGIGVSLENTRNAVAELSRHGIVTIGATVTADDLNIDADGKPIKNFFRVGPTNSDEAHAAVNYVAKLPKQRTLLVADVNEADTYAGTLTKAFQDQQLVPIPFSKKYDSLEGQLTDTSRDEYLQKLFRGMHSDICTAQPDVIYFAGRGVDLRSFVYALSNDGACQQLRSVTVISGDDTATLVGTKLPLSGDIAVTPLYTALAHPDQWKMFTGNDAALTYRQNYTDFLNAFTGTHEFTRDDLFDGAAMIEHDAVATAVEAAETNPSSSPPSMRNFVANIDCNSPVPGATGFIAFRQDGGNQIDKVLPILRIQEDGTTSPVDLVWSQGRPLDTSPSCTS
ncbi:amino acid ABC transporter substrate-binding protein [Amycolatopsis balhimycina DSM 5908]|uniref:Amino acid ABC transporter substrate-binding protein n=1 Tax=Amycolatopsis balhimycina DSM 5908 TaxID=1081091 RepID=A0A428W5S4_AMYBA|nr:ABC transporter substrate-binding protein [Amycolatopsis balhimycina]RSM38475.1 amino acid ABC transporter substrate-binding protein [Amycolatopsis balhimycina DSM 5908]